MASAIVLEFRASHLAVVVLLGLGAILVLPRARMPLLKSYCQRATNVLPSCVCYLAHLTHISAVKGNWVRITALAQLHQQRSCSAKKVKLHSCR